MPELPPDDPITTKSLSGPLLLAAFLLVLSLAWAMYDEEYGLRPWRSYQERFSRAYAAFLEKKLAEQKLTEQQLYASAEYKKLRADADAAGKTARVKDEEIEKELALAERQRAAMLTAFQTDRSLVGSLTYEYEIVPSTPGYQKTKQDRLNELLKAKAETHEVDWPTPDGKVVKRKFNYDELNAEFTALLDAKARLMAERGEADKPKKDAEDKLNAFVSEKLPGLNSTTLDTLLGGVRSMDIKLLQINVNPPGNSINNLGGVGLVDRCQSCHVATDPEFVPLNLTVTKADLGLATSHDAPFASHAEPELLEIHSLERFGCSPCHGGNGRALDSVTRGHGRYEHWLWPLYFPENFQAGCQQCHAADAWTEHADVLNRGRYDFRVKGCIGCHKYGGFDDQDEQLQNTEQTVKQLGREKAQNELEIPRLVKLGDQAPDNATAEKFYSRATNLTVTDSRLDGQVQQLELKSHDLYQEVKKVGPDLKDARLKLRKEWIPYWLTHTHEYRPTTKMPQFRLEPDQVKAIAAFIWQDALTGPPLAHQKPGDAAHGKQLFLERGCLACHSIGEGANLVGGDFAANLSRVGEKENYDYLVRWIHNPRQRTRPYCPYEKRDLGPEDYARHGLPFVFDLEHSRCPNDGHELEVQQPTVMPSLRLSEDDARDIASFLMTQKHADATYASADYMDDPGLRKQGETLVRFYGCAGCHEISGFEEEGRIGTELTNEGSKPIERLDFALLREDAMRGILPDGKKSPRGPWYDLKGFFDLKLANPAIWDTGMYKPDPKDRLRMPKPNLTGADINALTTFLLGSTDPTLPPSYMFKPTDQRRAIQEGWWIVTKYNCMGCHQIAIGQSSVVMGLPQYQGENKANLPPVLTFEGARVNPDWLKRFLGNPSLSTTDTNRNGVRSYLQVRMPTFFLSNDEIRKLVAFFEAMSSQAEPFIPPKLEPLTEAERVMARDLFTSPAAPCLKCHATGNPAHDKLATAPNFLLARDRLQPAWTARWIVGPAQMAPGTAMPSGLFRQENGRWIFNGPLPPALLKYTGDEADLLVRYMFELTPQEQGLLLGRTPAQKSPGGGGH